MTICLTRWKKKPVKSWQRRTLWWINKILWTSFAHFQSLNIIHLPKQVERLFAFSQWIAQLKGWQVSVRIYTVTMPKLCYPLHSIPTLYFAVIKLNCISTVSDFSVYNWVKLIVWRKGDLIFLDCINWLNPLSMHSGI